MILTEQHIITKKHKDFRSIDNLCFLSKNLYNSCLYHIKKTKEETDKFIRYNELEKKFKLENQSDYKSLPNHTSQQIMMLVDKNLKSYFSLLKLWKKDKSKLSGCPQFPKYKHKTKGRNVVIFTTNQAILKFNDVIKFPKKTGLSPLTTKITGKLNQVRIVPKSSHYVIEVIYEVQEKIKPEINNNYLSLDLGLNNLLTGYDSSSQSSFIINGKPLKSINQYYNKTKAKEQSRLNKNHNKHNSKKLIKLNNKRNNKIKDYLHKSSRFIVDYCVKNNIDNLVIGYNSGWKQNINLGRKNNQNFVGIPFLELINMIKYKSELEGLNFLTTEESYTSKCSSLDLEEITKHETYMGKRTKRGLFTSSNGTKINADLNGSINILRKVTGDKVVKQTLTSRGQVNWPLKINLHKINKIYYKLY